MTLNFNPMDYLCQDLIGVRDFASNKDLLEFAAACVVDDGPWLEFGVADGTTFQRLEQYLPDGACLYGFDGWKGFPTEWNWGDGVHRVPPGKSVGSYQTRHPRAKIIPGWFADTLPHFDPGDSIALIHIDCDVYESTKTVFDFMSPWIQNGTIIVFDELSGYPTWAEHEYKALEEWCYWSRATVEWFGCSTTSPVKRPKEMHGAACFVQFPDD